MNYVLVTLVTAIPSLTFAEHVAIVAPGWLMAMQHTSCHRLIPSPYHLPQSELFPWKHH